jgi:hypothetical protein
VKIVVAAVLAYLLISLGPVQAHWRPNTPHNRIHAINHAFCGQVNGCQLGNEALRVAYCESGVNLWPYARNGQYLGMFQFGSWARSTFGWSWSPWGQARAAYRYWRVSGWSGWACRP